VYTDTAGIRRFDILEEAIRRASARKVLFGSDGPWLHPQVELEKVYALKLPEADERLVLSGNFLRLIANVRRPSETGLQTASTGPPPRAVDPWDPDAHAPADRARLI
jgi:hypothetical protein